MIAASIMLGRPTIPHHNRSQPPFHPHLISRVVYAAIEMAEHGIRFISCQFINRFGKGSIHKQGFITRHWMFSQNRVVGGFFPIDRLGKLGREVILAVLSISSPFYSIQIKPSSSHRPCRYLWLCTVIHLLCRQAHNKPV